MQSSVIPSCIAGASWMLVGAKARKHRRWVLLDDRDAVEQSRFTWAVLNGYAAKRDNARNRALLLHRELVGLPFGDPRQADHINRNRSDCRRVNLRVVAPGKNQQNYPAIGGTSEHRGVRLDRRRGRWQAYCKIGRKFHHVGMFDTEAQAAEAAAAFRLEHMPFAVD